MSKVLSVLFLVTTLMFLVSPASADVSIFYVNISVPFPVIAGQPVQVKATVFTKTICICGASTIYDVRAVLSLPDGVALVSGDNTSFIGAMDGDSFATARWTVVFQENTTYVMQVQALWNDSFGNPWSTTNSTKIAVGLPSPSFDIRYVILIVIGAIVTSVLFGTMIFVRRKRTSQAVGVEQNSV
jgi:hypothetical protein